MAVVTFVFTFQNVDASARTISSQAVTAGAAGSPVSGAAAVAPPTGAGAAASSSKDAEEKAKDPEELKIMDLQIQAQREMDARLNKRGLPNGGQGERSSEKQPGEKTMTGG